MEIKILEYLDEGEKSPFYKWFNTVNAAAAAKIVVAIARMQTGNLSHCKNLGAGLWENKLDFGPGYRIYFGKEGDAIVILLAGGTKKKQAKDIAKARDYWQDYKKRRRKRVWH